MSFGPLNHRKTSMNYGEYIKEVFKPLLIEENCPCTIVSFVNKMFGALMKFCNYSNQHFGENNWANVLLLIVILALVYTIFMYHQTSNISHTLVANKFADHSDVVGSIACRRCSNYIFILDLAPGFNGLGRDNYKTRRGSFKSWD